MSPKVQSLAVGVCCLLLLPFCSQAQLVVFTPEMKSKIETAVQKILVDTGTPSAQIGVAAGGAVVFTGAYGLARVEPPVPSTLEMKYGIGSVSKQFTAAGVMLLVERGKLHLDDPISTWMPELAHSRQITLRMLLNQVSGYTDDYTEDYLTPEMATPTTPYALVKKWTSMPLDFTPGTKWQYSNINYVVVALIVEKVTGQPFFEWLKANVIVPAGLTGVIDLQGSEVPAVPAGYIHFAFGPARLAQREAHGTNFGDGQLAMPISDLVLWDTVVMKRQLLQPSSWQVLQAEVDLPDGSGSGYGMGFFLEAQKGRRVIEHSGGLNGFTTLNQLYPNSDVAIGVLTNADTATGKLVQAVEEIVFAPPAVTPIKADAAATAVTKTVLEQLAQGKLDRALLHPNLNFFFTDQVIADYQASLAPLGSIKSVETLGTDERGGMTAWFYKITATNGMFRAFIYITKDGKLDQLLIRR